MKKYVSKIYLPFFLVMLAGNISSCSLVDQAEKHAIRDLNEETIDNLMVESDSFSLNGYCGGAGPTLVFVHGFGGDAQLSWKQSLIDFSKKYRVVAMDLVWFGKSVSTKKANLQTQAEALTLFINEATGNDTGKFSMVGHSYGGFVSLATFFDCPQRVEKLVIVNSPGITYDVTLLKQLEKDANVAHYADLFVLENGKQIDRLNAMAFENPPHVPFFVRNKIYTKYFASNHTQLRSLLTTLPDDQKDYLEQKLPFPPSLVLWGELDRIFPPSEGEKLAAYMSAQWKVVPNVGHSTPMEDYEAFKEILTTFLSE